MSKLKNLLQEWPSGMVATYPWLKKYGIYQALTGKYLKSGWIESIGQGAFKKATDKIDWPGVVYALQQQLNLNIHVGSLWALDIRGLGHFARFENEIVLIGQPSTKLPSWCANLLLPNKAKLYFMTSCLFKEDFSLGLTTFEIDKFSLNVSSPERASIEFLSQVPQKYGFSEAAYIMENLISLRPKIVQSVLEQCASVKAKRLFMHLATRCGHNWLKRISLDKVNFGSGVRKIVDGRNFDKTYQLYVPDNPLEETNNE